LEQLDLQKRLILALALSFLVFVGSSYFLGGQQPIKTVQDSNQTSKTASNNQAPQAIKKPTQQQATSIKSAPVKNQGRVLSTITSDNYIFTIDELGRVSQATLLAEKYTDDDGENLKLFEMASVKPLEIRFADAKLNSEAFKVAYSASSNSLTVGDKPAKLTLTQQLTDLTITKETTFYNDGHYTLHITTSKPTDYFLTTGHRPIADVSNYIIAKGALIKDADGIITTIEDGKAIGDEIFNSAKIASAFDRYYVSMFYNLEKGLNVTVAKDKGDDPLIFVQGNENFTLKGYIGSKEHKLLSSLNPKLVDIIEYGWFTFASKPLFQLLMFLHSLFGNWGWAIIVLVLIIRLLLFPLTYRGMLSMQKMKDLAPKIKEIQTKYKGDPQRMNAAVMETYKKHGANPLGGCLPMLLQIPVFFAIYRVLLNAVELQGAPWILWINDLSRMDSLYILPLLMGASMY